MLAISILVGVRSDLKMDTDIAMQMRLRDILCKVVKEYACVRRGNARLTLLAEHRERDRGYRDAKKYRSRKVGTDQIG